MSHRDFPYIRVPQEVIDHIIDDVADGEYESQTTSLSCCSLVSTAFLDRSQKYLFRKIKLGSHSSSDDSAFKRMRLFYDILINNRRIAAYVVVIAIAYDIYGKNWESYSPTFSKIMDIISPHLKLREFCLEGEPNSRLVTRFPKPKEFVQTFAAPYITSYITTLTRLHLVNVPVGLIEGCVNLTRIDFTRVSVQESYDGDWDKATHEAVTHRHRPPRVLHLKQSLSEMAIIPLLTRHKTFPSTAINFSSLQEVTLFISSLPSSIEIIQQVLDIAHDSLRELRLVRSGGNGSGLLRLRRMANLARCSNLQLLEIDTTLGKQELTFLPGLIDILSTIPSDNNNHHNNNLSDIQLRFKIGYLEIIELDEILYEDWTSFATQIRRIGGSGDSGGKPLNVSLELDYIDRFRAQREELKNYYLARSQSMFSQYVKNVVSETIRDAPWIKTSLVLNMKFFEL